MQRLGAKPVEPGKYDLVIAPSTCGSPSTNRSATRPSSIARSATRPTSPAPRSPTRRQARQAASTARRSSTSSPTSTQPGGLATLRLGRRRRRGAALGPRQEGRLRRLPDHARAGRRGSARSASHGCVLRRVVVGGAVPAHAQRVAAAGRPKKLTLDGPHRRHRATASTSRGAAAGRSISSATTSSSAGSSSRLIKNGKLTRPLRDVAYQSNTLEFWRSLRRARATRATTRRRLALRRQGRAGAIEPGVARLRDLALPQHSASST